mmetsp:Transcript_68174/g.108162  ORF Transcript_68174/g.108162 Transcript_68174/m.108162 type:complete len:251 (-) Transcript_68174:72-824(-)
MAPPFEVPVAPSAAYRWLWLLRRAPGAAARAVYRQDLLKREIMSFLTPLRFFELHEAVDAALGAIGAGEVRLVRNVTLPAPLNHRALCKRHGSTLLWAMVGDGTSLTLRSAGGGPWRIRHHVPGGNGALGCALFCVGQGAQLSVHAVTFEIVCVPTGNPVKARLAVLPPLPEAPEPCIVSDSDDTAEEESSEVLRLSKTPGLVRYEEPNGAVVELMGCLEARGYDSHLVVRGSWAFNALPPRFLSKLGPA